MTTLRVLAIALAASVFVEAKWTQQHKRDAPYDICDPSNTNATIQCYCNVDHRNSKIIKSANCHLLSNIVKADDKAWEAFEALKSAHKVVFSNTRGVSLSYVPTKACSYLEAVSKLEIKYANIERIEAYAFANLTFVEEIILSDNQIKILAANSFSHHRDLSSLGLDTNNVVEINRNVFVDLPSLEKLYLTNNKITTIHDKAFIHLFNLKELEIDRNGLFSLNSETFSGLKQLQKLDLSGNNLEVIGDNTFLPLKNLKTLNLDGNKIQMLDEKAFKGLSNLNVLSLAHNNLTSIENSKIFEGLEALTVLSFKSNQLVVLKAEAMKPILHNFYGNSSIFDVEDNNFPCNCHLEWFTSLINKTQNSYLKTAMENLKCIPDADLKDQWIKLADSEKNDTQNFDNEQGPPQSQDYEYYDEPPTDGKLFYYDVRDLINCTIPTKVDTQLQGSTYTTKASTTTVISTTVKPISTTQLLLEPSSKATTKRIDETTIPKKVPGSLTPNHVENEPKKSSTTAGLATASEKTVDHNYDHEMASDEARTEKMTKLQRSVQDEEPHRQANSAQRNLNGVAIFYVILYFSLHF